MSFPLISSDLGKARYSRIDLSMEEKSESSKPFVFPVMTRAIEELFANNKVKKEDIEKFQESYWEQMVPNFSQALKLLDIHDVSRHSVLWSINDRLLEAVKAKIQSKASEGGDDRKLQKLWQKLIKTGMAYIQHPYMRSAIMMVLGKMNSIKSRHVSIIVENDYLYKDAPLPVLRHIWMLHQNKFNEELKNVLHAYQSSWLDSLLEALHATVIDNQSLNSDLLSVLFWPPRRRRKDASLLKIVEMIGESQLLYDKAVDFLRDESLRLQTILEKSHCSRRFSVDSHLQPSTSQKKLLDQVIGRSKSKKDEPDSRAPAPSIGPFISPALLPNTQAIAAACVCTVRFDLLMSLNKVNKPDGVCVADPIHHFVWCMDACIRNKYIDRRHACELAEYLRRQLQRRAPSSSYNPLLASEVGLDQDSSADWMPDTGDERAPASATFRGHAAAKRRRTGGTSGTHLKRSHSISADAGGSADEDDILMEPSLQKHMRTAEEPPSALPQTPVERDIQLICRDPWTVYTICTSLLRLVLAGLEEDKLPRDIPKVHFFVHLLMLGLKSDLTPPEFIVPLIQDSSRTVKNEFVTGKRGYKRPLNETNVSIDTVSSTVASSPASATSPGIYLLTQVLPAVGQLHMACMRAELGDEVRCVASRIWPNYTRKSVHAQTDSITGRPPSVWQRRLEVAAQFPMLLSTAYLGHPVGHLMLQYHVLFALERRQWTVLRVLLKAAASAAQQEARASKAARAAAAAAAPGVGSSNSKTTPTSPSPPTSVPPSYGFRWRPECLQAVTLGLASLPSSSDESKSDQAPSGDPGTSSSGPSEKSLQRHTSSSGNVGGIAGGSDSGAGGSSGATNLSITGFSGSSEFTSHSMVVSRAELASLLRATLPLQNDLQLLVLAQLSRLVPGTPPGPGSSGLPPSTPLIIAACTTPMPNFFGTSTPMTAFSSQSSERERMINALSRHCSFPTTFAPSSSSSGDPISGEVERTSLTSESLSLNPPATLSHLPPPTTTVQSSTVYRTSNPKVLETLEVLRRDFDKFAPHLMPLMTKMTQPSAGVKPSTPSPHFPVTSPLSPFGPQLSPTCLRSFRGGPPTPSTSSSNRYTGLSDNQFFAARGGNGLLPRYASSSSFAPPSSAFVMPQPPPNPPLRLPASPPLDYRPPSPTPASYSFPPAIPLSGGSDDVSLPGAAELGGSPPTDLGKYAATAPVNIMKPHSPPLDSPQ